MEDLVDLTESMQAHPTGNQEPYTAPHAYSEQFSRLEDGIGRGFQNVIDKLASLDTNISGLSTTILNTLSGDLQTGQARNTQEAASSQSFHAEGLMHQIQDLMTEKTELVRQIRLKDTMMAERAAGDISLRKEVSDLRSDNARLRTDKDKFRNMVLSNAGTQKVTDQEIIQAFSDVRQRVQQIASSSVFDLTSIPKIVVQANSTIQSRMRIFYNQCQKLGRIDMTNRVKSQIFAIVFEFIFEKTSFGLKRERKSDKNDPSTRELWDMEETLQRFEQMLGAEKGNENEIANWRIMTLDCITQLHLPEKYSTCIANYLEEFFDRLIPHTAPKEHVDEWYSKLLELTQKCLALKSMMQRSKDGYSIEKIDVKTPFSSIEQHVECMGIENGKSVDASDEIAYVLFGTLIKRTEVPGGKEKKILVRGEVILKPKAKGWSRLV